MLTDQALVICLSISGPWGCCHLLAFVNNVAVNMDTQVSIQGPAFNFGGYTLAVPS